MAKKDITKRLHSKTLEIHGGGSLTDSEIRPGLYRVIAFSLGSFDRAQRLFSGTEEGFIYTRINNPTVDKLEKRLAVLEGAEAGLATSSGMAAIELIALHLAHSGGHIVASNRIYGGTFHLFRERLPALGIKVSFVENPFEEKSWVKAIQPNTKFLYVENPSNPILDIFDIKSLANLAHEHKLPLVVDNTLATPSLLQPIKLGADIVIHSLSKYMGDGEVIGGAILGKKRLIDEVRTGWFRDTGPCISPDNAAILCYHIESLFGRMKEHCRNASIIAKFLSRHPKVSRVFYPEYGDRKKINKRLMPKGFGGLMAFEVRGGLKKAKIVLESLKLFWHAANIGEARSLVIHPATTTHGQLTPKELKKAGISSGTIRLSVGREYFQDLVEDLAQALEKI
ncbi:MAG: O-acetylhomoserine aminocarboxypropyltransferase/cysteine synthase [Candidatus Harrisonbacteria bacterium]|nr:O-acetylhomoserine aminocarboxypropyltransferase/cysteine synthase [Candidatus Harrisonbacteria bacterium]